MNILKQNIENIFGKTGKHWIASLPDLVDELAAYWQLNNIVPVNNMTFNYVAKAVTLTNQSVVLKVGCDEKSISDEMQALRYFDGGGSIQLISSHPACHALLLQQAIPGTALKSLYPSQIDYVMDSYIDTMKKLHNKRLPDKSNYRHVRDWLSAIDNLSDQVCPAYLIEKVIVLKNELLTSMTTEIFLHGDLHHDNILKDGDHWLAIDPKGVVGEPEFEIAAFDFMYVNELANKNDVKNIFEERVNMLAQKANLDSQRIKGWVFVRLILMAAWNVEDNGDPSWAIKLAEALM
jgi:streptomycin 6-kinase